MTEAEILVAVRVALGREPDLVLWRNSVGLANQGRHRTRYGLCRGSADLVGIGPGGVFVAWELKAGRGHLTPEQARFLLLVTARGGHARVIRSVDDARQALDDLRNRARNLAPARQPDAATRQAD